MLQISASTSPIILTPAAPGAVSAAPGAVAVTGDFAIALASVLPGARQELAGTGIELPGGDTDPALAASLAALTDVDDEPDPENVVLAWMPGQAPVATPVTLPVMPMAPTPLGGDGAAVADIPGDVAALMTGFTFTPAPSIPVPGVARPGGETESFQQIATAELDVFAGTSPAMPPAGPAAVATSTPAALAPSGSTVSSAVTTSTPATLALSTPPAVLPLNPTNLIGAAPVTALDLATKAAGSLPSKAAMPTVGPDPIQKIQLGDADAPAAPMASTFTAAAPQAMPSAPPVVQQFAAAMLAAAGQAGIAAPVTDADDGAATIQITSVSTAEAIRGLAIASGAGAQDAALDMRRDTWPSAMLDRIEALRDAADANDTRIRLVPDALGPIDVSVRKEGDTVNVRFTAENAQTRTLLTEAQPKLNELAETRGLKLGQTSVDAGQPGAGQRQQGQQDPKNPVFNHAPASALGGASGDDIADERIA